jgi:hypothetical protein
VDLQRTTLLSKGIDQLGTIFYSQVFIDNLKVISETPYDDSVPNSTDMKYFKDN